MNDFEDLTNFFSLQTRLLLAAAYSSFSLSRNRKNSILLLRVATCQSLILLYPREL